MTSGFSYVTENTGQTFVAVFTGLAGDRAAARELLADLLPRFEQASGFDHPSNRRAYPDFAEFTGRTGDLTGARDLSSGCCLNLNGLSGQKRERPKGSLSARGMDRAGRGPGCRSRPERNPGK